MSSLALVRTVSCTRLRWPGSVTACPNVCQRTHGRRHDSSMLHVFVMWWPTAMTVTMWWGFAGGCLVACTSFNAVRGDRLTC